MQPPTTDNIPPPDQNHKRLVLCFDGTGNTFAGNTSDTNVVKIYDKLKRDDNNQYHYYQTGIGTYDIGGGSLNKGFWGNIKSYFTMTIDEGFATSFDAHVMAGYKFVMRYYDQGDKIYLFGFSRGAYTARFLARMINTVGLLSKGNEEMVPFAYQLYQEYEQGKWQAAGSQPTVDGAPVMDQDSQAGLVNGDMHAHVDSFVDDQQKRKLKLNAFRDTFCRREPDTSDPNCAVPHYLPIQVYFLGIFDCVNSVSVLESPFGRAPPAVPVIGTATHVRHAVAVDERRVKFKAALLAQDIMHHTAKKETAKEVWFPGNHGDVGGGWPAPDSQADQKLTWWQKVKKWWTTATSKEVPLNVGEDPYQMSDIPLSWMIRELEMLGQKEPAHRLLWSERLDGFKRNFQQKKQQAHQAKMHDTMGFGGGSSPLKVLLWKFMEFLPFISRFELENKRLGAAVVPTWTYRTFPPNMGGTRDIPHDAVIHRSLLQRLQNHMDYKPTNNHGDDEPPCLGKNHDLYEELEVQDKIGVPEEDADHTLYKFKNAKNVAIKRINTSE